MEEGTIGRRRICAILGNGRISKERSEEDIIGNADRGAGGEN